MNEDRLPLLDLFLRLREVDLPLGIGEYQTLIRALQFGFGAADREALRRLCSMIWVKSAEEQRLFDYTFDKLWREHDEAARAEGQSRAESQLEDESSERVGAMRKGEAVSSVVGDDLARQAATTVSIPTSSTTVAAAIDNFVPVIADEVGLAQTMLSALTVSDLPVRRFLLAGEYFPVTRRQMKQSWRYLRRMVREGPSVNLNVEATVKKLAREGVLFEPVLEPRRINRAELLLIVDQEGSMVPFHALSRRLVETAVRGGRLGKAGVYYFHNCPLEHLFLEPDLVEAKSVKEVLAPLHQDYAVALVFSDAGAARGGLNEERVRLTVDFLKRLKTRVRRVAWLNPMPESRWAWTTAAAIARLAPMFELNRRGLDGAIDVLRGRYTPAWKGRHG
jgi:uncharacterized protein with von Willebrand factor type A (vWA) domain